MARLTAKWALTIAYTIVVLTVVVAAWLYGKNQDQHKRINERVCLLAKENAFTISKIASDVALTLDPTTDADTILVLNRASRRELRLASDVGDCVP